MKVALSIAGSDPTGGAGLQMDVQVFRVHGLHGAAVPTALTIQDTTGVKQILPTFPSVVLDQLRALFADVRPAAIKLGMLASDDVARNVALALSGVDASIPIVIDPILAASNGAELLERRARPTLVGLFPMAALVTPNRPEAMELSGEDTSSDAGAERAAAWFLEQAGAQAVLVKGGHRDGAPRDLLALRGEVRTIWHESPRIDGPSPHGTGCALSAAIAAGLAAGKSVPEATARAQAFVASAIAGARAIGQGAPVLDLGGPR